MATAVVCEDDPVMRRTLSTICEQVGLQVVAEVDGGSDAVELSRRFGVDVLILDLSLGSGISGKEALQSLQDVEPFPAVVVFTSYAADAAELIRLGARAVVEKPHLDRLITALESLLDPATAETPAQVRGEERRQRVRQPTPPPELWRSPSGISSEQDLDTTFDTTTEGDTIVVMRVVGLEAIAAHAGPVLVDDVRLAVARALRSTLRAQDTMHRSDEINGFVAVLRGGDSRAPVAAWNRLLEDIAPHQLGVHPMGACATVGAMGAREALARALAAMQSANPDTRLLISA